MYYSTQHNCCQVLFFNYLRFFLTLPVFPLQFFNGTVSPHFFKHSLNANTIINQPMASTGQVTNSNMNIINASISTTSYSVKSNHLRLSYSAFLSLEYDLVGVKNPTIRVNSSVFSPPHTGQISPKKPCPFPQTDVLVLNAK